MNSNFLPAHPLRSTVGVLLLLAAASRLSAQPYLAPATHLWVPDGPVNATLQIGSAAYFGGAFSYVGPVTGPLALVRSSDATPVGTPPRISGSVSIILPDGQGGFYLGGSFTELSSGQVNLVHLHSDLTLDPAFRASPAGPVNVLALRTTNLFVGGSFNTLGGSSGTKYRNLAAVDPVTGRTNGWTAAPNQGVSALILTDNSLYVGGSFTTISGQNRARLARLSVTNGAALSFNPGVSGTGAAVNALALEGTTLFVGGNFTTAGGKPRNRLAAIDVTQDTVNALDWNPNPSGIISSLALSPGRLYVGGNFTSIGGSALSHLALLGTVSGQALAGFNALVGGPTTTAVTDVQVHPDGLYLAGTFTSVGGAQRDGLAKVDPTTGALIDWYPTASTLDNAVNPSVSAFALVNNQVLFGGAFSSQGGVNRTNLAAVDLGTGVATPWNPGANSTVLSLAAAHGVLYVGGGFTQAGGAARARLAALDLNTGLATAWSADVTATGANGVIALAADADSVYLGGLFTAVRGVARANLAKVAADTGLIRSNFLANPNAVVRALLLHDTNVFVGGDFSSIGGSNRVCLASLSQQTGRSGPFNARLNSPGNVRALTATATQLYVAGDFSTVAGQGRRKLAALDFVTGDPTAGNPDIGVADSVRTFALATSGRAIYVGGTFLATGGEFRNYLASLPPSANLASLWNPALDKVSGTQVRTIHYGTNHLLVGGDITSVRGVPRPYLLAFPLLPSVPYLPFGVTASGNALLPIFDGDAPVGGVEVQASPTLDPAVWSPLSAVNVTGTGSYFEVPNTGAAPQQLFRLRAVPPAAQ